MATAIKKLFPRLDTLRDVPGYTAADGVTEKLDILAKFEGREVEEFVAAHPEYYASAFNLGLIRAWLSLYDAVFSRWNLEVAVRDLAGDGLLESAPAPAPAEVDNNRGVIQVRTDALMQYEAPRDERNALDKLRDDANLSDHQRKTRDRKLAHLAGQQRRELAPQNLYR